MEVDEGIQYPSTIEGLQLCMADKKGEEWIFDNVEMPDQIDMIVNDIISGNAIGVSDGSFKDEFGTAAWVIEDSTGKQSIIGRLVTPGFPSNHSAYRSEISGVYAMVAMVEGIKEVWNITKGHVTLGCDGMQAGLQGLDVLNNTTVCTQQSFDLLSGIQGYLKDSNVTYTYKHIKGHQD